MTKEEAKKFGLNLLHGIMLRNESYPVYANNVKQAIDALSEESDSSEIPNDLEEAAMKAYPSKSQKFISAFGTLEFDKYKPERDAFIAGAKWQAEQLLKSSPLPEDTVLFNKGVKEGKRLMMEEAVEGTYNNSDWGVPCIDLPAHLNLERFDKVRIIIVKEDEK